MRTKVEVNLRKSEPLPALHVLYCQAVGAKHAYDRMGETDRTNPRAYEHSQERNRLLSQFLDLRRALVEVANLLGPELSKAVKALAWAKASEAGITVDQYRNSK